MRRSVYFPAFLIIVTGNGLDCILHVVGAGDVLAVKYSNARPCTAGHPILFCAAAAGPRSASSRRLDSGGNRYCGVPATTALADGRHRFAGSVESKPTDPCPLQRSERRRPYRGRDDRALANGDRGCVRL
jgi:hypothetical protein